MDQDQNILLDLPEELIVKIFSDCQCIKPLLETSRKCRDIIKTNKCLYKRLIWNLDLISKKGSEYASTEGSIITEKLYSVNLQIPFSDGSKELVEKYSQSIEMAKIGAYILNLEIAHELSSMLQKMENLKELEYVVTGGHLVTSFSTLDHIEMPTFSNLKILKIRPYYTRVPKTYLSATTTFDLVSIFRHVTKLKELTMNRL